MPTYLYECEKCGRFEKMQRISEDPLEECPECGSEVKKLIGNPGIIFKGSGFYCTNDNSTDSTESAGSGDSESDEKKAS